MGQARGIARWEWALLSLVFLASLTEMVVLTPKIHGDGVGYFAYLRSVVFDGDLSFANEFQHFGQRTTIQMIDRGPTPTGLVYNVWSVGPAIMWSPFYLGGHLVALVLSRFGWQGILDGYSAPYVYAVALGSAVYAFLGLLLTYRLCRGRFPAVPSLMALATVWFATSLTAYMYFHPSLSHAASFFLVAAFFSLWWSGRDTRGIRRWALLGLVLGLMAMVRLQNALYVAPAALYEVWSLMRSRERITLSCLKSRIAAWMSLATVAAASFLPQAIAWQLLYGKPITNPYAEFTDGVGFAWLSPRIWDVLFSSKHGLVSWTPAVGLALVGLVLLVARGDGLARALALAFLIQLYLVSAWSHWWQGASFGGRMFIELTPAFVLGLAALISRVHRTMPVSVTGAVVLLLALWNALFMLQYGTGALPLEDYISWYEMIRNQFSYSPALLLSMVAQKGPGPWLALLVMALVGTALLARWLWVSRSVGRGGRPESRQAGM